MFRNLATDVVAYHGCKTWGLQRTLGSYILSFLTNKFKTQRDKYRVWNYTDVGLILISEAYIHKNNRSVYVANPVTQECVEIPSHAHFSGRDLCPLGIATRTENGVLLGYKVVNVDENCKASLGFLIYSSETGLWTRNTVHLPFSLIHIDLNKPISLHGTLHWIACNDDKEYVVISIDFFASGTDSVQYRATPFPDFDKVPNFNRICTTCQGFLMYMNIVSVAKVDGSLEDKLCVWRLKNEGWQLVSEVSRDVIDIGFDYVPLGMNPFDAKTFYFWSTKDQSVVSVNLSNGKFELHSKLERSKDGFIEYINVFESHFPSYVLPRWLHRIPERSVS